MHDEIEDDSDKPYLITDGSQLSGSAMPRILTDMRAALIGRTITDVGYLVDQGDVWPCLVLDDGTQIVASRDDEGNGPGSLFGKDGQLCRTHLK